MPNDFYTVIDLEKLSAKLEELGFVRDGDKTSRQDPNERSRAGNEPPWNDAQPEDEADPWATDQPRQENRSRERSAPSRGSSNRASGNQRNSGGNSRQPRQAPCASVNESWPSEGTETDRFDRVWYFGEQDAPDCKGGHVAAMVEGVSQQGKDYRVWACPVGSTRDYKKKCDLWEYV